MMNGGSIHGLQLVDVGMEDAVREADAGRLVRVGIRELDVDLPQTTFEGGVGGALESDVEVLPLVFQQSETPSVSSEGLH